MKFIKPSLEYLDSYLETLKEFEAEGFPEIISSYEIENNKEKYIENTKKMETAECIEMFPWLAPSEVYWLVDDRNKEFIGRVSIRFLQNEYLKLFGGNIGYIVNKKFRRKGYATQLLKFALEKAKEKNLAEILITCDEDNIPSKKTIEKCNGIHLNSLYDSEQSKKNKLRYRILLNKSAHELWQEFLNNNANEFSRIDEFNYACWQFGDSPNQLADLILKNIKKATSSLFNIYEEENITLPKVGDYNIILNSKKEAVCLIKTIKTDIKKFKDVDREFAFKEGEGDQTLEYWQKTHKKFFLDYDENFNENTEIFLEEFQIIYPKLKNKNLDI